MKRILFVDDEPNVLQGLRRMLHSMRAEWEMQFAGSGAEALILLARAPVDVIITDMRMPGMDGAALLTAVRDRYPNIVRLVLSGHAQQEMAVRSVGPIHQFLAKPCDAEILKATVTRACALRALLADDRLKRLVSQIATLPSLPALYLAIIEELQSANASAQRVGAIISRDVGMAAKVLHLVNSAFFGLRRHVASPGEAVKLLGLETIKSLVLSVHIFLQVERPRVQGVSMEALWHHSLATGTLARRIAVAESVPGRIADYALMAGLLHDVGKLILISRCTDAYAATLTLARAEHLPLCEAERRTLHSTHAEVGAYLLGLWGLPDPLVEAIAYHHSPGDCPHREMSALTAVHAANALAEGCHGLEGDTGLAPTVDEDYLRGLGLSARLPAWQSMARTLGGPENANERPDPMRR
jgi:putative nucleotidyltransferase with HDIG domain